MRVLDISAYYHDSLAARRALHHVNDHEPDTFSEKVRVTVMTAIQLAGTRRALLADDSQAFIETMFRLNTRRPLTGDDQGAIAVASDLGLVAEGLQALSPLGWLVSDSIREYKWWFERDRSVVDGVGESMPFTHAEFDRVLIYSAHQYMNIPKALKEIFRVLRPGGQLQPYPAPALQP